MSRVIRHPYMIGVREQAKFKDTYGGEPGWVFIEGMQIRPEDRDSKTAIVFSHPIGGGAFLPMMTGLAEAGHHVIYINTRYRRTSTPWYSRYESSLMQAETYLLVCQRYIELNPVRAAMVDDPAHYRWTSYRYNTLGKATPYLSPHPLYLALGKDDKTRRAAYRHLFRAQLGVEAISDIRLALRQNQPWRCGRINH